MTQISYIHDIPRNEYADRGQYADVSNNYVPYLSLTRGELDLYLLRKQAELYARFYPEVSDYRKAVTMIDNALNRGVSNGVNFMGPINDGVLQYVASAIQQASRQTAPSSDILIGRESIMNGVGELIPVAQRREECMKQLRKKYWYNVDKAAQICAEKAAIEQLINSSLEGMSHHVVYNGLEAVFAYPARVEAKRILHQAGVEGFANAGELPIPSMYNWTEISIQQKNASIGIGPIGSIQTSFYLSENPEKAVQEYTNLKEKQGKTSGKIGIDPVTVSLVIAAITAATTIAGKFLDGIFKNKNDAMAEAKGFGTQAYSATKTDWPAGQNPIAEKPNNNILLLAAAGAALWAMSEEG